MKFQLMDLFAVGWLIVSLAGISIPSKSFVTFINEEHMSKQNTEYYKGIFAIGILLHHVSQRTNTGILFHDIFNIMGSIAVSVFFFISGYGLQKSFLKSSDYSKGFLKKRLSKVLVPYLVITFVRWIECFFCGTVYSVKDVVLAVVNGVPIVPFSWYIISIILWYIVYWALMKIFKQNYLGMVLGAFIVYIAYALTCIKLGYGIWWYIATPAIILGMVWAIFETKIIRSLKSNTKRFWIIYIICFFCLIFLLSKADSVVSILNFENSDNIIFTLRNILITLCFVLSTLKFKIGNRGLSFLGKISFEIYLVQGLLIEGPRWGINNEFIWVTYIITATIIVAYLFHIFNKKITKTY